MIYIVVAVSVVLVLVVFAPFFHGLGGLLAASSSVNSPAKLEAMKTAVLQRFLADEAAFKNGDLSRLGWDRRKDFLVHRYIDAARRLDYLTAIQAATHGNTGAGGAKGGA